MPYISLIEEIPVENSLLKRRKNKIGPHVTFAFSGKSEVPTARLTHSVASNDDVYRKGVLLSLKNNLDYARIIIDIPDQKYGQEASILVVARLRADRDFTLQIGFSTFDPVSGWKWIVNSRTSVAVTSEPHTVALAWPIHLVSGSTKLLLQLERDVDILFIDLRVVAIPYTLPERQKSVLRLDDPKTPEFVEAGRLFVLPANDPATDVAFIVIAPDEAEVDSRVLAALAPAIPDLPLIREHLGPNLTLARAQFRRPPILEQLQKPGVDPALHWEKPTSATGPLMVEDAQVYFSNSVISVTAILRVASAGHLEGRAIELRAGAAVIQKAQLQLHSSTGECTLKMETMCSRRTAALPLSLHLVGTDLQASLPPAVPRPAAPASLPPGVLSVAATAEGSFDGLRIAGNGSMLLHGWARDPAQPGMGLVVDFFLEEALLCSGYATGVRRDVPSKRGGSDVCGFSVELPPNIAPGLSIQMNVRPRATNRLLTNSARKVHLPPYGSLIDGVEQPLTPSVIAPIGQVERTCAAVILTQDGAEVLEALLASVCRFEAGQFRRIVIVDHESQDQTSAVIGQFAGALPIDHRIRSRESSFSASNNYGASICNEDVIFFINNDIVLTEPITRTICGHLGSGVGVVGCRLVDPPLPISRIKLQASQHLAVHFTAAAERAIRPFESRMLTDIPTAESNSITVPAVTGALFVMERASFEALGGFDESFFYGWEDIDLCLRALAAGLVNLSVNSIAATHIRAYSRRQMSRGALQRRSRNPEIFNKRWAYALRNSVRASELSVAGYWTGRKLQFGFVVSEFGPNTTAGDYMTALDFANALMKERSTSCYFFKKTEPLDARNIDILFVMTDDFDVRTVTNLGLTTLVIAWARNWFHRWAARPWRERFHVWFASSEMAQNYLRTELGREVGLLRIGTNAERFAAGKRDAALTSDVAFTGHYWGSPRGIADMIDNQVDFDVRFFGQGWEKHPTASAFAGGALAYDRMADVYASTKLVIDDSNFATASWGALNSRVFDALAAGTLVITNNEVGVQEAFAGLLPVYKDAVSLRESIMRFVNDDELRQSTVAAAQAEVLSNHTYRVRVGQMLGFVRERLASGLRIAIKIGCPSIERVDGWGDWYFANSLRRELEDLGHTVRIDCLADWQGSHTQADDVCLCIRGLERYQPDPHQINAIWVISHPDRVSIAELVEYDLCFAASPVLCNLLASVSPVAIQYLPQCTDHRIFYPDASVGPQPARQGGLVFVGNSRNVMRPIVQAAVQEATPVSIYGDGWDGLIPAERVKARLVPNADLGSLYRGAEVVLNDHWDDMRRWGIISNRIFDALACGTPVVSDDVPGLAEMFGPAVHVLREGGSLKALLTKIAADPGTRASAQQTAQHITAVHTFKARAVQIDRAIRARHVERQQLPQLPVDAPAPLRHPH